MKFCLDTNVFVQAWNGYYAMDFFPDYWESFDRYAQKGIIFSTEEVKREISTIDDELNNWLSSRGYFFKPIDEKVQEYLEEVFKDERHHRLVDSVKGRSKADPWVIAHALAEHAIVVTKEESAPPNTSRIKIPNVCDDLGIEWINDYDLIRQLGLKFTIEQRKMTPKQ